MTELGLGPGAEFDVIRGIARALGPIASGLGNDCAYLELGSETLAVSTDSSVEGVHFRRGWLSHEEIGWRAAAAALSDLAAAGAREPRLLASLTVPDRAEAVPLMQGVGAVVASVGGLVVGGDLTHGHDLSLTITVLGRVTRPIRRSGARPGDGLWVTGHLGLARAALVSWQRGETPAPEARARFAHPEPRLPAGRWLVEHGATAMLDLSDGLAGDSHHLAAASGCRIEVELGALPIRAGVKAVAEAAGEPAAQFAAEGGEDYELLVAMPGDFEDSAGFVQELGLPLTRIGSFTRPSGGGHGQVWLTLEGHRVKLRGYDHFR
jgi:thiamine-monophosphate kinase